MGFKLNTLAYIYNKQIQLEDEYNSILSHFRYHRLDEVDMLEIIIAKARKDLVREISKDLQNLLAISKGK